MFLSNGEVVAPTQAEVLGDRTPVFADRNYYASASLPLLNQFAAYSAIYKNQHWVGTVVRKLAMATARMPFEVKLRTSATDSVNESGPMTDLLSRPNPGMSGFKLWEWTSSTRDVYGEAFWVKLRDASGRVRELHPMHPTNVIVRRQADGTLGYVYSNGTVNVSQLPTIPAEDVVAFTNYNPDDLVRGLSVLEGLRMTLLNEDAARRATASMWQKGARPGMILTTDQELTDAAAQRIKMQFDRSNGGADNTGATAVFEQGLKAQVIQLSAEEMQYIESRKLNREEVCAAYDVPQPAVGILDHATFSNITEQLRSLYRDTMAPRFIGFESVIDHQLVPDFYPVDGSVFTRFNMEDVLRGDFETKATATVSMRNSGFMTGNEARAYFGLPRLTDPEMDKVYANAALVPLGEPQERITVTEDGDVPDPDALPAIDAGELTATPTRDPRNPQPREPAGQPANNGRGGVPPAKPLAIPAPAKSVRTLMGRLGRAQNNGATTKTWHTDPECATHTALNGETVPIKGLFSNMARVPGDTDTFTAPCGCDVDFGSE